MVALLHVLSAAALVVSQAAASPAQANTIHALLARQTPPGFNPGNLPEQCRERCLAVTEGLTGCTSISCVCKDSTVSNVAKCLGCGVQIEGSGITLQSAQEIVDQIVSSCSSIGSPVKGATVSTKDNNGVARTSALSAGAVAVAALGAVFAVA